MFRAGVTSLCLSFTFELKRDSGNQGRFGLTESGECLTCSAIRCTVLSCIKYCIVSHKEFLSANMSKVKTEMVLFFKRKIY